MASSKDVADRAGVSRSTVSQVLNGHGYRFAPETVAKVRDVAEHLGYRPSAAARTLARGTSDIVITLVPNVTFGARLRDLLDVLTVQLEGAGYTNLLHLATSGMALQDAILDLRPHAVVSLAPLERSDRARLERHGALVVEQSSALQEQLDVAIGRRQAQHLAESGYQVIAAAVSEEARERRFTAPRAAGLYEWALQNGLQILPPLQVDLSRGAHESVLGLPDVPVGIGAYNDEVALSVLGAAQQLGRNVPHELGIIGVDNTPIARIAVPTITTMDFDLEFSARQLLRSIVERDPELPGAAVADFEARLLVLPAQSTARASTATSGE